MNKKKNIIFFIISTLVLSLFIIGKTAIRDKSIEKSTDLTSSQKKQIAEDLLIKFYQYEDYLKTHELEYSIHDAAVQEDEKKYTLAVEYNYNSTKMYDCILGLTGVYNDVIDEKELRYVKKVQEMYYFNMPTIFFGYTKAGAHIICITPIEYKAVAEYYQIPFLFIDEYSYSQKYSQYPVLSTHEVPIQPEAELYSSSYIYLYVEDLTNKATTYDLSLQATGYPTNEITAYNDSEPVVFYTNTINTSEDKVFANQSDLAIKTYPYIVDRQWTLLPIEKNNFKFLGIHNIEITIDNEVVSLSHT